MTKVLIVGSGGREHALGWKLSESEEVSEVLYAPGNAGTQEGKETLKYHVAMRHHAHH